MDTLLFLSITIGHDIARDLYDHGVGMFLVLVLLFVGLRPKHASDVTMFQRSSTYVMSVKHGVTRVFGGSLVRSYETHMATKNLLENRSLLRRRSTTRRR
jgi:hypothetical protein